MNKSDINYIKGELVTQPGEFILASSAHKKTLTYIELMITVNNLNNRVKKLEKAIGLKINATNITKLSPDELDELVMALKPNKETNNE